MVSRERINRVIYSSCIPEILHECDCCALGLELGESDLFFKFDENLIRGKLNLNASSVIRTSAMVAELLWRDSIVAR